MSAADKRTDHARSLLLTLKILGLETGKITEIEDRIKKIELEKNPNSEDDVKIFNGWLDSEDFSKQDCVQSLFDKLFELKDKILPGDFEQISNNFFERYIDSLLNARELKKVLEILLLGYSYQENGKEKKLPISFTVKFKFKDKIEKTINSSDKDSQILFGKLLIQLKQNTAAYQQFESALNTLLEQNLFSSAIEIIQLMRTIADIPQKTLPRLEARICSCYLNFIQKQIMLGRFKKSDSDNWMNEIYRLVALNTLELHGVYLRVGISYADVISKAQQLFRDLSLINPLRAAFLESESTAMPKEKFRIYQSYFNRISSKPDINKIDFEHMTELLKIIEKIEMPKKPSEAMSMSEKINKMKGGLITAYLKYLLNNSDCNINPLLKIYRTAQVKLGQYSFVLTKNLIEPILKEYTLFLLMNLPVDEFLKIMESRKIIFKYFNEFSKKTNIFQHDFGQDHEWESLISLLDKNMQGYPNLRGYFLLLIHSCKVNPLSEDTKKYCNNVLECLIQQPNERIEFLIRGHASDIKEFKTIWEKYLNKKNTVNRPQLNFSREDEENLMTEVRSLKEANNISALTQIYWSKKKPLSPENKLQLGLYLVDAYCEWLFEPKKPKSGFAFFKRDISPFQEAKKICDDLISAGESEVYLKLSELYRKAYLATNNEVFHQNRFANEKLYYEFLDSQGVADAKWHLSKLTLLFVQRDSATETTRKTALTHMKVYLEAESKRLEEQFKAVTDSSNHISKFKSAKELWLDKLADYKEQCEVFLPDSEQSSNYEITIPDCLQSQALKSDAANPSSPGASKQ
ncbi:MAG: hypothetical protein JSS53_03675 [Proteobacteria bacterium]|nr:hypothetical protein [Pseudomonadota bacterium]